MTEEKLSLRQFAQKRAVTGATVAGLLNGLIVHLSLRGTSEVPIFALVAEEWKHSLLGALVPRALLISLLVTVLTVWATVKSRSAGTLDPPIAPDVPWVGRTLRLALKRAAYGFGLVLGIALVLRLLLPKYSVVSAGWVTLLVALFAAAIAFLMSYTAVIKAGTRG